MNLKLLPNDDPGQVPVEIFHPRREAASFYWEKNGQPGLRDSLPSWNLTLDLMTSSNRRRGSMTIQRLYTQRDLQLDVNLLTAVFPVALADALDRVFSQPREVIARPEQTRTLVAVQAG